MGSGLGVRHELKDPFDWGHSAYCITWRQAFRRLCSNRSLLRRFRAGQSDAATLLYLRYADRLRALAARQAIETAVDAPMAAEATGKRSWVILSERN